MRKLLLFPALAVLYVLGCSGDSGMPCGSCGDDSKCGNEWYNSFEQFCYGGSVYSKCGGMVFAADKQGCCGSEIYDLSTEFCSCYNKYGTEICHLPTIYSKCGGKEYDPLTQSCFENGDIYNKCGKQIYDPTSRKRCMGSVIESECGSDWYNPATYTQYCKNGTTLTQYGSLEYAGQTYRTVEIGTQTWMAENLNYNPCTEDFDFPDLYCNSNYSGLYFWRTAKTVCPSGWHLPSVDEWSTLVDYVESNSGCSGCAGNHLRTASGDIVSHPDTYGFSAMPSYFSTDGSAIIAYGGIFWSSSGVMLYSNDGTYGKVTFGSALCGVRCLRD
jgi:uncharacterized protein (TIGR02145 family)